MKLYYYRMLKTFLIFKIKKVFAKKSECCKEPIKWRYAKESDIIETGDNSLRNKQIAVCSACSHVCGKKRFS